MSEDAGLGGLFIELVMEVFLMVLNFCAVYCLSGWVTGSALTGGVAFF